MFFWTNRTPTASLLPNNGNTKFDVCPVNRSVNRRLLLLLPNMITLPCYVLTNECNFWTVIIMIMVEYFGKKVICARAIAAVCPKSNTHSASISAVGEVEKTGHQPLGSRYRPTQSNRCLSLPHRCPLELVSPSWAIGSVYWFGQTNGNRCACVVIVNTDIVIDRMWLTRQRRNDSLYTQ